jgi:predicted hydrocarbon binding protein
MAEAEVKDADPAGLTGQDKGTGVIRAAGGKRAVVVTGALWKALTDSLAERLADELDTVLYSAGHAWGAEVFADFAEKVCAAEPTLYDPKNMPQDRFQREFNDYLAQHGWGRFDMREKYDLVLVELVSSAFPEMQGKGKAMTCSLMAGFFSGFFTGLTGIELGCLEVQCAAGGAEKCTFVLAESPLTDSIHRALSKGRTFDEIVADMAGRQGQGRK